MVWCCSSQHDATTSRRFQMSALTAAFFWKMLMYAGDCREYHNLVEVSKVAAQGYSRQHRLIKDLRSPEHSGG